MGWVLKRKEGGMACQVEGAPFGNSTVAWSSIMDSGTCIVLRMVAMRVGEMGRVVGNEARVWSGEKL